MNINKKELKEQYKRRRAVGGVYTIRNNQNGKQFLDATVNLQSIKNRFDFSKQNNTCIYYQLKEDWTAFGANIFEFNVLEEITQGEVQTDAAFKEDVMFLKEIWLAKLLEQELY